MMGYAQVGVPLPRTAAEQFAATAGVAVPRADAQPGDLLFGPTARPTRRPFTTWPSTWERGE